MTRTYIVAEEYLDKNSDVYDSTILLDTDDLNDARDYAEKHIIDDERRTQVAIWEMEDDSCRDSWIVKNNFDKQ